MKIERVTYPTGSIAFGNNNINPANKWYVRESLRHSTRHRVASDGDRVDYFSL